MKAPARKSKDTSHLTQDIVAALVRQPLRSIDDLAEELGFTTSPIRSRMNELLKAGQVKFVIKAGAAAFARLKLWSVTDGSEPLSTEPPEKQDFGRAAVPRQATTRQYPPINRRDPLVASLFGPAGSHP